MPAYNAYGTPTTQASSEIIRVVSSQTMATGKLFESSFVDEVKRSESELGRVENTTPRASEPMTGSGGARHVRGAQHIHTLEVSLISILLLVSTWT